MNDLILTEEIKNAIKVQAFNNANGETVGFILKKYNKNFYFPVANSAKNKESYFSISAKEYARALCFGEIVAVCHSHNEREDMSSYDVTNMVGHNVMFVMFCKKTGKFIYDTTNNQNKYKKYLGRQFSIGKNDCFSLLRDFYQNECGITIADFKRGNLWYEENPGLIIEGAEKEGFSLFNKTENKKLYDVLIYSFDSRLFPMHFGIYLGADEFLHHPRNEESKISKVSDYESRLIYIGRKK